MAATVLITFFVTLTFFSCCSPDFADSSISLVHEELQECKLLNQFPHKTDLSQNFIYKLALKISFILYFIQLLPGKSYRWPDSSLINLFWSTMEHTFEPVHTFGPLGNPHAPLRQIPSPVW